MDSKTVDRLGKLLTVNEVVTPEQLAAAIERHKKTNETVAEVLLANGTVTVPELAPYLEQAIGFPFVDIADQEIDPELAGLISESFALTHSCLPVREDGDRLYVAMADPLNFEVVDELRAMTGRQVVPTYALRKEIEATVRRLYDGVVAGAGADHESQLGIRHDFRCDLRTSDDKNRRLQRLDSLDQRVALQRRFVQNFESETAQTIESNLFKTIGNQYFHREGIGYSGNAVQFTTAPGWWNGRRGGLKNRWPQAVRVRVPLPAPLILIQDAACATPRKDHWVAETAADCRMALHCSLDRFLIHRVDDEHVQVIARGDLAFHQHL